MAEVKIKTSELTGIALDLAVGWSLGGTNLMYDTVGTWWITIDGKDRALSKSWAQAFTPSTNWAHAGPIIEREKIGLNFDDGVWSAYHPRIRPKSRWWRNGTTPLSAAMRAFVASKLGNDVDIPEELCK